MNKKERRPEPMVPSKSTASQPLEMLVRVRDLAVLVAGLILVAINLFWLLPLYDFGFAGSTLTEQLSAWTFVLIGPFSALPAGLLIL
jgi:hypothetical protein